MTALAKDKAPDKGKDRRRRDHPRHAAKIPVQVEVVHAWKGAAGMPLAGTLVDISRGGAALRLDQVLPPRTRLRVAMATVIPGLDVVADVVWTPLEPSREASGRKYGLRWRQSLSRAQFEVLMPLLAPLDPNARKPSPGAKA